MRLLLAVLLFLGAASVADARPLRDEPPPALPAPDAALPRQAASARRRADDHDPAAADRGRGLGRHRRRAARRDLPRAAPPAHPAPLAERRTLGDRRSRSCRRDVRGEARDTVAARRHIAAIPRGKPPKVRTASAAPAADLRAAYDAAQRRFGIHWSVLAAVNFVESAFGRVRSASESGALGPMQFMPATWRAYGMGGDMHDPGDAILAAANYLHASGRARRPGPSALRLQPLDRLRARDPPLRRAHARRRARVRDATTRGRSTSAPSGGSRRITGPGT